MAKRKSKSRTKNPSHSQLPQNSRNIWLAAIFLILILWAAITALFYSPYSIAVGVLVGFLSSRIINEIKN